MENKECSITCKYCYKIIHENDKEYIFLKDKNIINLEHCKCIMCYNDEQILIDFTKYKYNEDNIEMKLKYIFKNKKLLEDAIKMSEELRFIGESILNIYITESLLKLNKFNMEIKTLEKIRNKLIYNKQIFKDFEKNIGMESIIIYITGAIYYDSGMKSVNNFLDNILMKKIKKKY